jgi:lipoyl-dependent peroxiredoxin
MAIKRRGSATWQGGFKDGKGALTTESGALKDYPHGCSTRFEDTRGSNPEELIGAALAGCFTMALSLNLGESNLTADHLEATADVSLEKVEGGFSIPAIHLTLKGRVPGADEKTFKDLAEKTKAGCPVSKLLIARITLDATLVG